MKAIRLHGRGGPHHLVYEDAPQPRPGAEEVLVRVYATGVIANELKWDVDLSDQSGKPARTADPRTRSLRCGGGGRSWCHGACQRRRGLCHAGLLLRWGRGGIYHCPAQ